MQSFLAAQLTIEERARSLRTSIIEYHCGFVSSVPTSLAQVAETFNGVFGIGNSQTLYLTGELFLSVSVFGFCWFQMVRIRFSGNMLRNTYL